jgi:hypothetical protein
LYEYYEEVGGGVKIKIRRARPKIEWGLKPLQETTQVLRVK